MADDRQPQPCAARQARPSPVDPIEALEDPLLVPGRDPHALVDDRDLDRVPVDIGSDLDERPSLGVLDGVVDQVADSRDQVHAVSGHRQMTRRIVDLEPHVGTVRRRSEQLDGLPDDHRQRDELLRWRLVGLDPRQVQQVIDDAPESLGFGGDPR